LLDTDPILLQMKLVLFRNCLKKTLRWDDMNKSYFPTS